MLGSQSQINHLFHKSISIKLKADCKSAGFAFDGSNPSPTTILRSKRSGDQECRAEVPRSGRRRAGATAKLRASTRQASTFDFRLPIYDLAAGELKLQMKSSAKDEEKKKEAGHYSGLSMRTKRLNQHLVAALLRTFCWLRRRIHTPCFTHGTLRFCIPTMRLRYQRPCPLPVTSSGYTQTFENKGKSLKFGQRRRNLATASVRVRTCSFS